MPPVMRRDANLPKWHHDELVAEVERLREALDMAVYHAENLRRFINRVPVRDLGESEAGFQKAKAMLEEVL